MRLDRAAVLLAILALAACNRSEGQDQVWRFAIEEPRGSVQHAYATKFKELIEERTDGEIEVKVYPYGTLGTSDQTTELLHNGSIEFVMASPGHLGKLIPEVQVFLLHFVLSEDEHANYLALRDPDLRSLLDELYRDKGFAALSFFTEGWMVWTLNKEVREPADFSGLKIRVMTSPILLETYDAYGAEPTPLAYSEVYSALQLNMIDGQVNPIFAIQEMSFYEVTQYMVFPRAAQFVASAMAGAEFFDGLSEERRALVRDVVSELESYIFDVQREFNRERLEQIKEEKPELELIHLSDEERAGFRERALGVHEWFVHQAGGRSRELLNRLLESVEEAELVARPGHSDPSR